jgi:hypothetical protein
VAIASNFNLAWSIDDANTTPTATFKDVRLDLGSFFQVFAESVVGNINQVL